MTHLRISPDGAMNFAGADIGGEAFYMIEMMDVGGSDRVDLVFRLPHFVAFADHLKMIADELSSGHDRTKHT